MRGEIKRILNYKNILLPPKPKSTSLFMISLIFLFYSVLFGISAFALSLLYIAGMLVALLAFIGIYKRYLWGFFVAIGVAIIFIILVLLLLIEFYIFGDPINMMFLIDVSGCMCSHVAFWIIIVEVFIVVPIYIISRLIKYRRLFR